MKAVTKKTLLCVAVVAFAITAATGAGVREQFADPPPESRLQAWYHWTTTGITDECLAADFKAMGELGVGTAHVFMPGAQDELPPYTQPLTDEWWKRWETAIREAKKNNIRLGFHNCPGWSSSGGKWIKPEDSMKVLVAAATDVADLVHPVKLAQPQAQHDFYRDIAVYAFPIAKPAVPVKVSGDFEADFEAFRRGEKPLTVPIAPEDKGGALVYEYAQPIAPKLLVTCWNESQFCLDLEVAASSDGTSWTTLATRAYCLYNCQLTPKVLPLAKCPSSRFFRIKVTPGKPPPWVRFCRRSLASAEFSSLPLVSDIDDKNSASVAISYRAPADPDAPGIARDSIIDLTHHLKADGVLDLGADVQNGDPLAQDRCWRILRVGYTTSGKVCAPAPRNVRGLECDKLSKRGLDAHWPHMPHKMINASGGKGTVSVAIIDSWEVGGQNWTEEFPAEFARRRGYDIRPWLPAMAGYTVGTAGETAKFLFDVQRTVADLMAENYYDYFAELCHREGVKAATESYDGPFDNLRCFASADIPTGEFWLGRTPHGSPRTAASAGHLHGRKQIAAEAFTTEAKEGRWQITPHELRVNGDRGWLDGVSQLVYHSYLQQLFMNVQPGFSLGRHGTQFNRHTTWWPEGKWWAKYVHRGQFLLQSGEPKADLLILTGDGKPNLHDYQGALVGAGYNYDRCGVADLRRLEARDGGVAMPGRLPYDVLWLGDDRYLTCATLRKVKALLDAGARVAGVKPKDTPTLADDTAEWRRLVDVIWSGNYPNLKARGSSLAAMRAFGVRAPVESGGALSALRRVIEGRDFYFVVNGGTNAFDGVVSFKGVGRPERWDAKTGKIEPLPWYEDEARRVKARIALRPDESMFVSFREPKEGERPSKVETDVILPRVAAAGSSSLDISSNWTISSFTGKNPPIAPLAFPKLVGWNTSSDEKLKYFAGRAMYERKIDLGSVKEPCELDLGDVRDIANVWVDGLFLGCLWEAPYRVALPPSVTGKMASLRVEVVNTWPNRLIGDAVMRKRGVAEPKGKHGVPQWVLDDKPDSGTGISTWSNWLKGWTADDEPRPAGLLGPVRILMSEQKEK